MTTTNDLLKKYIQKKKEYDAVGDEVCILVKNGMSIDKMDQYERKIDYIKDDLHEISRQFIEQFIIKD